MLVIPLWRLRQKDQESEASLGCIVTASVKTTIYIKNHVLCDIVIFDLKQLFYKIHF